MSARLSLSVLLVAVGLSAAPAVAANNAEALAAGLSALRLDFGRDGVVGSDAEVEGRYREACELGYEPACRWRSWRDDDGLPSYQRAATAFGDFCGKDDPVACIVSGWAIEAEPVPAGLTPDARAELEDGILGRADKRYRDACSHGYTPACYELARDSLLRARLGVGDPKVTKLREDGARKVFDQAGCRKGHLPSCIALAELLPQDASVADKPGSAGSLYAKACEGGSAEGCHREALLYAPVRSVEETRSRMDELCGRGHTASCAWAARSYGDTAEDRARALDAWRRACLLRDATGCRNAGQSIEERAPAEAIAVHDMGCRLGVGESCGRLGVLLLNQQRPREAIAPLDKGCAAGHVAACVQVGLLRFEGQQVEASMELAQRDLMRGCPDDGPRDPAACHALGRMYQDAMNGVKDRATAAKYHRYACIGGHAQSCFLVGESVLALQRSSQTDALREWALDGYVKACDAGLRQACVPAARLYESGPPSVRNLDEARRRWIEACRTLEIGVGCRGLGMFLLTSGGTAADQASARDAFQRGRELDDSESTRQLAKMMFYGQGGKRQRGKANKLFREACAAQNPMACGGAKNPDRLAP